MKFKNKVVFITGGGGYIGGETAYMFAKEGASVAICDVNEEALSAKLARINELGVKAQGYLIDVTDSESVNDVVATVVKDFGRIDISVHVAGGSARIAGPNVFAHLIDQKDYVIDKVLKVNLYGAMYVARAVGKYMVTNGVKGRIISFSSVVGQNGLIGCSDYAAAKAGVSAFTKSFAKEVSPKGITANCVAPGIVQRPGEENDEYSKRTNFLGEICTAEDVGNVVLFLASDEARFITGQTYVIDGGRGLAMKGSD